jgi:hypothetical protein
VMCVLTHQTLQPHARAEARELPDSFVILL